jgi:nucleoside-diphosphate-sugar epimerase
MSPRCILVVGNMGYVGPAVVRRLRDSYPAARIHGADVGYFAHCLTGAEALPERLLDRQYFVDIREITPTLLEGVDAVVNLAAVSNDPMGKAYERATREINFKAGVRLARLARDAGVASFVFASSCSVYGQTDGRPVTENDSLAPLTAYARSKIDTEVELEKLATPEFFATALRFPTACGMSDRLRLDLVLNDFVAGALTAGNIQILSDGTPWRPLIDTRDMARAIDWALQRPRDVARKFLTINVGRNEANYQVKDLAQVVARHLPGTSIEINPNAPPDKRSYQVDFSLYRGLAPAHLPQCSLDDSVSQLIAGLRRMAFADVNFRESGLIRLRVLNALRTSGVVNDLLEWPHPAQPPRQAVGS